MFIEGENENTTNSYEDYLHITEKIQEMAQQRCYIKSHMVHATYSKTCTVPDTWQGFNKY